MRSIVFGLLLLLTQNAGAEGALHGSDFPLGYYSGDPLPPSTVYLTFDDGPAPDTAGILDILKAKGVRATFFINAVNRHAAPDKIGTENNLLHYKDVLKRMIAEGHVIGNHTFSHRDLGRSSAKQIGWQLDTLQKDLDEALGADSPHLTLIRPPFGSPWLGKWSTPAQRTRAAAAIQSRGIVMNWTRSWDSGDSADWVPGEAQRLRDRGSKATHEYAAKEKRELDRLLAHSDGTTSGVLLFHDTHPTSRDVLAQVIDTYKALGYSFDTLDNYARWRWGPDVFKAYQ